MTEEQNSSDVSLNKPVDQALLLDNQLCFALYATSHAFTRFYKPRLDALGLTYPQYLVMLLLWEDDHQSVKNLGERLFLDSGTLTPLLKRLESAGFVERVRDTKDERQVNVSLTSQGHAHREKASCVPKDVGASIGLSSAEARQLTKTVLMLREKLAAES